MSRTSSFSGLGVFIDDVGVTVDGAVIDQTSFETDFGGFEAGPPPAGSEAGTQRTGSAAARSANVAGPGLATQDTLTWGFGFEGVSSTPPSRTAVMRDAMRYLGILEVAPPPEEPPPCGGHRYAGAEHEDHQGPEAEVSRKAKAKFKFRSNEAGSTFECRLDDGEFEDCDSPQKYRGLDPGRHRFRVRATDAAGNTDGSPAGTAGSTCRRSR